MPVQPWRTLWSRLNQRYADPSKGLGVVCSMALTTILLQREERSQLKKEMAELQQRSKQVQQQTQVSNEAQKECKSAEADEYNRP